MRDLHKADPLANLFAGQPIEYRPDGRRKWFPAMYIGRRDAWVIIRLNNGSEYEIHPKQVRSPQNDTPKP